MRDVIPDRPPIEQTMSLDDLTARGSADHSMDQRLTVKANSMNSHSRDELYWVDNDVGVGLGHDGPSIDVLVSSPP